MKRLSELPVRPSMPIAGMSLTDWAAHYRPILSDWFISTQGAYASEVEWLRFVDDQFSLQQEMDAEFEREKLV